MSARDVARLWLKAASLTLAGVLLLLATRYAPAADQLGRTGPNPSTGARFWLSPGGVSYHSNRDAGFNERNGGVLLRYAHDERHALIAGVYRNSNDARSRMVAYRYTPLLADTAAGVFKAGLLAGVVDGYQVRAGGVIPVVLPVLAWESRWIALSVLAIPPVQKHIPSWVIGITAEVALW